MNSYLQLSEWTHTDIHMRVILWHIRMYTDPVNHLTGSCSIFDSNQIQFLDHAVSQLYIKTLHQTGDMALRYLMIFYSLYSYSVLTIRIRTTWQITKLGC